jgi:hypothetical protein
MATQTVSARLEAWVPTVLTRGLSSRDLQRNVASELTLGQGVDFGLVDPR